MLKLNTTLEGILTNSKGDFALCAEDAAQFQDATMGWLLLQKELQDHFSDSDVPLFNVTEKSHFIEHAALLARYINPRMVWCFAGEDQQRRTQQLAETCMKGLGPVKASLKMMSRYRLALARLFSKHGHAEGAEKLSRSSSEEFRNLGDLQLKALNLARTWLSTLFPHIVSRIHRVHYGLLDEDSPSFAAEPLPRRSLAVPFVGKDAPSETSQFSHPDVLIGLTWLAFRFGGLRQGDFRRALRALTRLRRGDADDAKAREAARLYNVWVREAGGHVRGLLGGGALDAKARLAFKQGSPESFDGPDLRGENILVDPSVVGFDRLAVLRPQKPRLPSDEPDQPTAYFLPPVLPKKAVAQREPPADGKGHNGARNKAAVTTKAKDESPMEDQYSLTHTDSMDRVDPSEAKDRQLSAQSELLQLHLKAIAKPQQPQLQLSRSLFHSTTTDMGSEDGGIHLEASEAFRRLLESLLQQHVRELNDLASIGAAGTRSRTTEPKLKSNPTSPNSVFSRVTKEMDKCVSDNVDSILASTGLRLFQARNILDVLDGDQQELFEKPKGHRLSRKSSDFLPELFEDSEEQTTNSYKDLSAAGSDHRSSWVSSSGFLGLFMVL
ncbi:unnamed protein product [Symbiodinium sp. CCMP2592]|nr:unnamed protein product [Symbiodinium sp. CCMP2592]